MHDMDDKRQLYHYWTRLRRIKPWYFLILAALSGVLCVFALRANNIEMVRLRDAVYQADKDNGDVEGTLRQLRSYVYAHMNTSLASGPNAVHPPIQLKYTYDRLIQAKASSSGTAANSQIYTDAQHYCEKKIPDGFSGRYRIDCIQQYVTQHTINAPADKTIPKNLYQFDFTSPTWSPDLAGWSLMAMVVFLLLFVCCWFYRRTIRRRLRAHR